MDDVDIAKLTHWQCRELFSRICKTFEKVERRRIRNRPPKFEAKFKVDMNRSYRCQLEGDENFEWGKKQYGGGGEGVENGEGYGITGRESM